jgi:hypothetical protein
MLVGCVSSAGDPIGCVSCLRTRHLWLPPRVTFFSHIGDTHCYCSSLSSPSDTTRSLFADGHSYSDNNTHSLSLSPQKVTRLICVLRCPRWPVPSPPPAARALRIVLNFCPQKARAAAGRLAMCVTAKGASRRRPRHPPRCRLDSDIASDPPPRGRAHLVESPHQGGN